MVIFRVTFVRVVIFVMNYFEFAIILYNIEIILSKHNVTCNFVFIGLHLKKMDFLIVIKQK